MRTKTNHTKHAWRKILMRMEIEPDRVWSAAELAHYLDLKPKEVGRVLRASTRIGHLSYRRYRLNGGPRT